MRTTKRKREKNNNNNKQKTKNKNKKQEKRKKKKKNGEKTEKNQLDTIHKPNISPLKQRRFY